MTWILQTFIETLPNIRAYFIAIALFMVAEQIIPAERKQSFRGAFFNARYTLLFFVVTPFVLVWPTFIAGKIASATNGSLLSMNLDSLRLGVNFIDWPVRNLLLPFVPMFVFDFFYYWHHRLQHQVPGFWAQHKLHHMDENLCCLTNLRHHWLEDGIRVFTITVPMTFLIALTPVQGAFVAMAIAQWAVFIHSNLRIPLGPLTPVFAGPQLHRIHHSREVEHTNRNYAAFFPLWDIIFGTYYRPARHEWPQSGLPTRETVHDLWTATMLPFRGWVRMLVRSAK